MDSGQIGNGNSVRMRLVNVFRALAALLFASVGALFFFLSSIGYSMGLPFPGIGTTLVAAFSVLCLIGAAVMTLGLVNLPIEGELVQETTWSAVYIGVFLVFATQFIPFPLGCNLDAWPHNLSSVHHGCPAGPVGVWSTIWPNVLTTCVGVRLVTTSFRKTGSRNVSLPGLGLGLMIGGFVSLVLGLSTGYTTSCPANG